MKFLFLTAILFGSASLYAKEEPINPTVAHFFYSSNCDEPRSTCAYQPVVGSPYDFKVQCPAGSPVGSQSRIFDVHIAVTHLDDSVDHPRAFVEFLYWIQDLGTVTKPHSLVQYGTTVRLNSRAMHGMEALDLSQDLGSAEQLHFELRLPATQPLKESH
jgi:hypothetical protein